MTRRKSRVALVLLFFCTVCVSSVFAQSEQEDLNDLRNSAPKVFMDFRRGDRDYFRENLTYVNYVRDRKDADIHILVTQQGTGSGGQEYTFSFIGLKEFAGRDHTLVYASGPTDTRDETRQGQLEGKLSMILSSGILSGWPICR